MLLRKRSHHYGYDGISYNLRSLYVDTNKEIFSETKSYLGLKTTNNIHDKFLNHSIMHLSHIYFEHFEENEI